MQEELDQTLAVLRELWAEGAAPDIQVVIPRLPAATASTEGRPEAVTAAREKALYRLALAGVVDDYTVEHGANTFTVKLAKFTEASVDAAAFDYMGRVQPGRSRQHRQAIQSTASKLDVRIEQHVGLLIKILYQVIEPARLFALQAIYNLCRTGTDDQAIRLTINGYLSDGPLAAVLTDALTGAGVDIRSLLRELDKTPPADRYEWAAAATRQLESFGPHPALLVVRALGEAWKPDADSDEKEFQGLIRSLFASFGAYEVSAPDAAHTVEWMTAQLRNQLGGERWGWVNVVWRAWDTTPYPDDALIDLEDRVLAYAVRGNFDPRELDVVAFRRARRLAVEAAAFASIRTTGNPKNLRS